VRISFPSFSSEGLRCFGSPRRLAPPFSLEERSFSSRYSDSFFSSLPRRLRFYWQTLLLPYRPAGPGLIARVQGFSLFIRTPAPFFFTIGRPAPRPHFVFLNIKGQGPFSSPQISANPRGIVLKFLFQYLLGFNIFFFLPLAWCRSREMSQPSCFSCSLIVKYSSEQYETGVVFLFFFSSLAAPSPRAAAFGKPEQQPSIFSFCGHAYLHRSLFLFSFPPGATDRAGQLLPEQV